MPATPVCCHGLCIDRLALEIQARLHVCKSAQFVEQGSRRQVHHLWQPHRLGQRSSAHAACMSLRARQSQ